MATQRQKEANQQNAQQSTGPVTDAGKAKSARNRLSWGFASCCPIIPGEDPEEFKQLLLGLLAEFNPDSDTEQIYVERMAFNQWLALRSIRLQSHAFYGVPIGEDKLVVPKDLGLLIRYQNSAERNFDRNLNQLAKLQKERKKSEIGFDPQKPVEAAPPPPPAPPSKPEIDPEMMDDADLPSMEEVDRFYAEVVLGLKAQKTASEDPDSDENAA